MMAGQPGQSITLSGKNKREAFLKWSTENCDTLTLNILELTMKIWVTASTLGDTPELLETV